MRVTIHELRRYDHYAATVISASFKGKSRVQQHRCLRGAQGQMGGAARSPSDGHALMGGVRVLAPKGGIAPTGTGVSVHAGDLHSGGAWHQSGE
jgi:hypothetical protein